jgi:PKD repeat protein
LTRSILLLNIKDDDGGIGIATTDVIILDLAPTAEFRWSPEPQNEGSAVQFSDESTSYPDVIVAWSWDFGDTGTSNEQNPVHTYGDNDIYFVNLTVTDDDQSQDTISHNVTILNVAPIVEAGSDQTVNEGDTISFSGSFTDPGWLDTHIIEWDFGDGDTATGTLYPTHVYCDNGVYTVTLRVTDDDQGADQDTLQVTVNNVPPTANGDGPYIGSEGSVINFTGIQTDPGVCDTFTYEWDYDYDGVTFTVDSTLQNPTNTWGDDLSSIVAFRVTDDNGGVSQIYTTSLVVDNLPPIVEAGSDQTVNEGDSVSFSGSFTDPGWLDTHIIEWDFGDGNTDTGTLNPTHVYCDNGIYTVTLKVTDDDQGVDQDTLQVTVNNVSPIASAVNDGPKDEGTLVTVTASQVDPGTCDTFTYSFDWDNDGIYEIVDQVNPSAQQSILLLNILIWMTAFTPQE